jgi:hypothetical protein
MEEHRDERRFCQTLDLPKMIMWCRYLDSLHIWKCFCIPSHMPDKCHAGVHKSAEGKENYRLGMIAICPAFGAWLLPAGARSSE